MIRVAELFAGVGGFRIGLEKTGGFKICFSNQWEPGTKKQWASEVYEARFGKEDHTNIDINEVESIPNVDLLVGGFPCQDYSVASTSKNSKGLIGKKGVLWWSIHRLIRDAENKPKFLMFENVDRLLKSPTSQRGRDFAVILKSLQELGYAVEWRVINAADYGMPQRRRRIFILGYLEGSSTFNMINENPTSWILEKGIIAKSFPAKHENIKSFIIDGDIVSTSSEFNKDKKISPFEQSGCMILGNVVTAKPTPLYDGNVSTLGSVLLQSVAEDFYIDNTERWEYLKGPKKEKRITSDGFEYFYSEGGMSFPDPLDKPSRTIITGEGGKSASRCKHIVSDGKRLRRLSPIELERLNMFPDNHTYIDGISDTKRAFFMGNALVVGIVEKLGKEILEHSKI
jgi:DNA (cytosine-5)-methyltransferase 1